MTTPTEIAQHLINRFTTLLGEPGLANVATMECVDMIIDEFTWTVPTPWETQRKEHWVQVKEALELL